MEPNNPEARVSALESQVRELTDRVGASEQDAAAARVLTGAADRDVAAIIVEVREFRRATVGAFNASRAFRGDFNDLRRDYGDLRGDFNELRSGVERGFTEMRGKFDATVAGQQRIAELIKELVTGQRDDEQPGRP